LNKIKERNHILICGWNSSTNKILSFINNFEFKSHPTIVLVNELDEERFSSIQNNYPDLDLKFIKGDFTNQEILNKANIKSAKQIILLYDESKPNFPPSDERTIIAAHNIIYMKLSGKISLQLKEEKYLPNIRRDKVHNVVIFDEVGGNLLANSTVNSSIPDFVQEILKFKEGKGFNEVPIPEDFINSTFRDLFEYMKEKKDLIVLGIVSAQMEVSIEKILSDDSSSIDQFIKHQFELSNKKFNVDDTKNYIKIKPGDNYIIQESDRAIVL
jgi:voltage-gated potassium channel